MISLGAFLLCFTSKGKLFALCLCTVFLLLLLTALFEHNINEKVTERKRVKPPWQLNIARFISYMIVCVFVIGSIFPLLLASFHFHYQPPPLLCCGNDKWSSLGVCVVCCHFRCPHFVTITTIIIKMVYLTRILAAKSANYCESALLKTEMPTEADRAEQSSTSNRSANCSPIFCFVQAHVV